MSIIDKFTEEQGVKILDLVKKYLNKHEAWGGEMVSQDDNAQTDAVELCCEIADVVSHEFYEDDKD